MMNKILLASAATLVAVAPAYAQQVPTGTITGSGTITYNNLINTELTNTASNRSDTTFAGNVNLTGDVAVDTAGQSISDVKQINNANTALSSNTVATDGTDTRGSNVNSSIGGNVNADGNVGVSTAAGDYNQQANIGTISVASGTDTTGTTGSGGWASANSTAAQSTTGTYAGPELDGTTGSPTTQSMGRNAASVGDVAGAGNIGVNSTAGAFNSQANIMTLAVASDSSLAQANAGIVQLSTGNLTYAQDSLNSVATGTVSGAGNIGVNAAAGVGNEQINSLTVAASGAFGGNGTGGAAGINGGGAGGGAGM